MAELDWIDVCWDCLSPVEGTRRCPNCGTKVKRIPSAAFQTLRVLRAKAYRVLLCRTVGCKNDKQAMFIFEHQAPGEGWRRLMRAQIDDDQHAVCSTWRMHGSPGMWQEAYEWARDAPSLDKALPFTRFLCEKCTEQYDRLWLHGACRCPSAGIDGSEKPGDIGPWDFETGFPEDCFYLPEQVMTRDDVREELGIIE